MDRVPDSAQLSRDELVTELETLRRYTEQRDAIVRAAHAAGLTPHRIHVLSGIGRNTVYRILGR